MDQAGMTAVTFVFAMIVGMPIFFTVIAVLSNRARPPGPGPT